MFTLEIEGGETLMIAADTDERAEKIAEEYVLRRFGEGVYYELYTEKEKEEITVEEAAESIQDATADVMKLLLEKNAKYGNNNLTKYGHTGIIVRLSDKLARLENLSEAGAKNVKEYDNLRESIEDVYKDIAGYGINGYRLMKEGRI